MYKLMAFISLIVRQFVLPNPFEALGEGLTVTISGAPVLLAPVLLNLLAEPVLHALAYGVTGIYYQRGSDGAQGSFLYLIFYCVHIFLLWLMSLAGFATWAVALILAGYFGCHVLMYRWTNGLNGGYC